MDDIRHFVLIEFKEPVAPGTPMDIRGVSGESAVGAHVGISVDADAFSLDNEQIMYRYFTPGIYPLLNHIKQRAQAAEAEAPAKP